VRLVEDKGAEKRGKQAVSRNVHSFLHARRKGKCGKHCKWFLNEGIELWSSLLNSWYFVARGATAGGIAVEATVAPVPQIYCPK
jgi:hypothetical protein